MYGISNDEAQAYAELAMRNCGISLLNVKRVTEEMHRLMDEYRADEVQDKLKRDAHKVK